MTFFDTFFHSAFCRRSSQPPKAKRLLWFSVIPALFVCLFICLFLLRLCFSVHPQTTSPHPGAEESSSFRKLTEELLLSELSSDTLSLHYTLADPSCIGLTDYRVCLPSYRQGEELTALAHNENLLSLFASFESSRLTASERRFQTLLLRSLNASHTLKKFPYYQDPLSAYSGMHTQLPILLAEYTFRSPKDVDEYLKLLEQTGVYFDSLLCFEQKKAENGCLMCASSLDKVISQCQSIITRKELSEGRHFLQITFRERLAGLCDAGFLSQAQSKQYDDRNSQLLQSTLLPAYEHLATELSSLRQYCRPAKGLAAQPGGQAYYEALLYAQCSTLRPVSQIKELLYVTLKEQACAIQTLLNAHPTLTGDAEDPASLSSLTAAFPYKDPAQILAKLQEHMKDLFPSLTDTDPAAVFAPVKTVSACMADYCAPAFYLTAPLDDITAHSIYINEKSTPAGLELYTTLAHEGFPGHMYQTVFHNLSLAQDGLTAFEAAEELLWFGGYLEGWALYVEFMAYEQAAALFTPSSPSIRLAGYNRSFLLCLYSILDLMIHYDGACIEDISEYLAPFGITDTAAVASLYEYIAEEPANYLKYYLGYLEILELKEQARTLWQDSYSDLAFHTFYLQNGPADFQTLWESLPTRPD